jgi:hypothetical protein
MTEQHKATPEQWADQEIWAPSDGASSCLLELRARVEALEDQYETMRLATLEWGADVDKVKRWGDQHLQRIMALEAVAEIRSGPESLLVERVADAIASQATSAGIVNDRPARAAILEVAKWLKERQYGSDHVVHTAWDAAAWLEQEATR